MSGSYVLRLEYHVRLHVEFTTSRREVISYAVILTMQDELGVHTIRVYDAAHGFNELHRHTRSGGKRAGEVFHHGTLGEGLRAAISMCEHGYERMIEGWNR
jgi:hypothetical protein